MIIRGGVELSIKAKIFLNLAIVSFLILLLTLVISCKNTSDLPSKESSSLKSDTENQSVNQKVNNPKDQASVNKSEYNKNISNKRQAKLPKVIDLGADKCIPCIMMKPILDDLRSEYSGKLDVEIIDVWQNPKEAEKYNIKLIPTQIFYDPDGNEFYRHEGFMSKEDILDTFRKKGIKID